MTGTPAPRFRITVHQLHAGKTTKVIDAYGDGFITAIATFDGEHMDVQFNEGGTPSLQRLIAQAVTDEYSRHRPR